jgi:hypothetical protein
MTPPLNRATSEDNATTTTERCAPDPHFETPQSPPRAQGAQAASLPQGASRFPGFYWAGTGDDYLGARRQEPDVPLLWQIRDTAKRRAGRALSERTLEGCPRKSDPISARSSASSSGGTRRCWGGLNPGRSWVQENRSASQKRRQPWLTFSISLIPGRTTPPARWVQTCTEDVGCGCQNSVRPGKRLISGHESKF